MAFPGSAVCPTCFMQGTRVRLLVWKTPPAMGHLSHMHYKPSSLCSGAQEVQLPSPQAATAEAHDPGILQPPEEAKEKPTTTGREQPHSPQPESHTATETRAY